MYRYIVEEFFKGGWLYSRSFDNLEYALDFINILKEKHNENRYRLIEVIKDV